MDNKMKLIEKIFSVKNRKNHKIVHLLFFRMKFRQQVSNQELLNKINAILCNEEKIIGKLVETSKPKKGKAFLPFLSLHLVDKCNNNCESCSHFCTLADNFILNPSDYEKDLTILAHKFNVGEIDLMGGEPLLHPQIVKIFDITRRILPQTFICLHTNGILLTKMPDEFWEACQKNKIAFKITKYPVMKNFSEVVDLCLRNEIRIETLINGNEFLHWMDRSGNGQIEENFHACKSKFGCCYILRNSKLYTCPTACYMDYYNRYFNTELPVETGIDIIYSSPEEILNYLKTPLSCCRYCRNINKLKRRPWKRSQRKIDEWEDAEA